MTENVAGSTHLLSRKQPNPTHRIYVGAAVTVGRDFWLCKLLVLHILMCMAWIEAQQFVIFCSTACSCMYKHIKFEILPNLWNSHRCRSYILAGVQVNISKWVLMRYAHSSETACISILLGCRCLWKDATTLGQSKYQNCCPWAIVALPSGKRLHPS